MFPFLSPQIKLCDGSFQAMARSKKSSQLVACAILNLPLSGAVPGSWSEDLAANARCRAWSS
jgi:hypothetical protein